MDISLPVYGLCIHLDTGSILFKQTLRLLPNSPAQKCVSVTVVLVFKYLMQLSIYLVLFFPYFIFVWPDETSFGAFVESVIPRMLLGGPDEFGMTASLELD